MKEADLNLKCIVFRACLVAVWTDSSMSADERRFVSHLTEVLADSEEEREALRKLRLEDLNEGQVLGELAELSKQDKEYVFDTCLEILVADRTLDSEELVFLKTLRKSCGISAWSYNNKLWRVLRRAKARVPSKVRIAVVLGIVLILCGGIFVAYLYDDYHARKENITPAQKCSGQEIMISILNPNGTEGAKLLSGEEVFKHVKDSIVSVTIFINNDRIGSGSGSVIGKDELGTVYVLTNRHVVHNSDTEKGKPGDQVTFEVQQYSGAKFDAELDYFSRKQDLALLSVKGMESYSKPLKLILKKDMHVGQPVYAIGTPIRLKDTFTAGVVSALRESELQTDATVYYGSSGGPLVDQHGALCGVVTETYIKKNYAFALYSDHVLEMLKDRRKILPKENRKKQEKGTT